MSHRNKNIEMASKLGRYQLPMSSTYKLLKPQTKHLLTYGYHDDFIAKHHQNGSF